LAAGARPGGNELRKRQRALVDRAPVHAVGENIFALRPQRLAWAPERDDVVVDLLFARYLDQSKVAGAPGADRFDPPARAALIAGREILEVAEVAPPLQQAESARVCVAECADLQVLGIGERAP